MTLSDKIQAVLRAKAKALVDKSSAMLSEITDPSFVYVTSRGTRVEKDAYIARICTATDWRFGSQTVENLEVVDFDTFAVATMTLHDEFVHAGGTTARTYQSLCVFRRAQGKWLWVAGQTMSPETGPQTSSSASLRRVKVENAAVREDPAWVEPYARTSVRFQVSGMESVTVDRNVLYRRTADGELALDIYRPAPGGPVPVVVVIHGGPIPSNLATSPKDWAAFQSIGRLIAASGCAAVVVNHRYFGSDRLADAVTDIRAVFEFIASNAGMLGFDPYSLGAWVFSGGGRFVASMLRDPPSGLRAIVAYYAVLDADRQEFSALHTLTQINHPLPPMLVARAGLEQNSWLQGGLDRFVSAATTANLSLDLLNHPTGHHGFDVLDEGPRTREILAHTLGFIRNRLLSQPE